jgi:uncharacterized repeat protein (TIGR01451 family)
MRKRLLGVVCLAVFAATAVPAVAHEDPVGCTTTGSFASLDPSSGLSIIHRNGDHLDLAVRVRNDFAGACSITDATITVRVPAADGTAGPATTVTTTLDLPGGSSPSTLAATAPYDVAFDPGVFSGPVSVEFSGTAHLPGGDVSTGLGTLTTNVAISRPHVTLSVTPGTGSGPAPFNATYDYSVTNDSPPNPPDPVPALVATSNDTAVLIDDGCSPLVFTGGDTTITDPPLLQQGETWTFTCMHMFGAPGSFTNHVAVAGGSTRDGRPWPATTAQSTVTATGADVAVTKAHSGSFVAGDRGRAYVLTVRNAGNRPTSGTVTLTDELPTGLTATAVAGTGWSCELGALRCTRSNALAAGAAYPPVTVSVDVAPGAAGQVSNVATVSGGGEPPGATGNNVASDPTTIAEPSNAFRLGKANSGHNGKVKLTADVPGPGKLRADDARAANLLKRARATAERTGAIKLHLRPTRAARRKLGRGRSLKVKVRVEYTPTGGSTASRTKKVRLRP